MLTKPECGWTYFQIDGEHEYIMGYLTDVAIDWLEQAIHGLKELSPFTVRGFSEPGRVLCTASYWNCYVIEEEEHKMHKIWSFHDATLSMIDFCKRLYRDISKDIDAWVMWDTSSMENLYCVHECRRENCDGVTDCPLDNDVDDYMQPVIDWRKGCIQEKLDELKRLIDENEEHFGPNRCFF